MIVLLILAAAFVLAFAGSAGAASPVTETSLSNQAALTTQTQMLSDGTMTTLVVKPDSTAALTLGGDGYPCDDVGYNGIVKHYWGLGWVSWTYHSHFGVHVCHNKVGKVTSLYDEPTSTIPTWSWCGNIIKEWGSAQPLPYSSAHSHTKGCFALYDKIVVQEFPWVRITIGGNGGLWDRSMGTD